MSEKSPLTRCNVCQSMVPPDQAVYDKGMDYPEIAKTLHDDDTVTVCLNCNQKLQERDVPNTS